MKRENAAPPLRRSSPIPKGHCVTEVEISTLSNGIRVVSDRMPHLASASVGVWVDAGARHEREEENGISHMLEHMLFKGTARRSARAIAEEIENVGGHMNAYTSRDHTSFYAKVLKEHVPLAVDILADILQHSLLDADEVAREREVVIQEIGQAIDTPDDIVFDYLQAAAFPDQPLGRPILGTEEHVAGFTRDMLATYVAAHYRGPGLVVAAAGNIEHRTLVDLVGAAFDTVSAAPPPGFAPATYEGGRHFDRRDTEQLHLTLGFPSVAFDDPDYYAVQVLSTILGGGMSSRLFQEIRETRGLAYSIYSFTASHADTGLFGIYAGSSPEVADELVRLIAEETRKLITAVEPLELERARAQLKAGLLMSLESTSSRIEQLARQVLIFGRVIGIDELVAHVDAVDPAAVSRAAERMLSAGAPSIASVGPTGTLPDYDRLAALFR